MVQYKAMAFTGFNKLNPKMRYTITLNEKMYNIEVRWNFDYNFGVIILRDENYEVLKGATALVNGLKIKIDQRKLKGYLRFVNINKEKYEPDINNIEEEFALIYVNE